MKAAPLLAAPLTLTTTLPVEALDGTRIVIDVSDQAFTPQIAPLMVTVLLPWVAPKLVPVMLICADGAP